MRIREFERTPEDYQALAHILNAVWIEPPYTVDDLRRDDEGRVPNYVHRRFVAVVDDRMVGYGSFEHSERFYHPQRFWMGLDVLPDQRRQGIGTRLYDHMLAILKSDYDANELHAETTESRDYSLRFLQQRGFEADKRDPMSRLDLATFDWARFEGLDVKIAAMGIQIHVLSDLMREDVDALHKVYELHQMLVRDVPEPAARTKVDFESWKDGYSSSNPYFIPDTNFMALHEGDYIGMVSLWGLLSEETLHTGMTGVKRAYRRKGLATALKLRTVAYAQAQGKRAIMTLNNSENPMLQLNLKLGSRIYDTVIKLVNRHPGCG